MEESTIAQHTDSTAQQDYKSISALANQLDIYYRNSPSIEFLFQPKPILLRKRFKDKCTKALLSKEFTIQQLDKIEDLLWNHAFYRVIQKCRNSPGVHRDSLLQNAYRTHITAGIGFYTSLISKMTDAHSLKAASFLDWNRYQVEDTNTKVSKPNLFELYIYKFLIHLGDLSRYQQVYTHNSDLTKRFYYQAIILNPYLGHAYNQIAGMYPGVNYNLDSVYFYLRAIAGTDSIAALSEVNIKGIYDKNRMQYNNINTLPSCNEDEKLIQRFLLGFIRLQEVFSPVSNSEQNGKDMEYLCSRLLKEFEGCLTIDEICSTSHESSTLTTTVGGDPLFKICIITILTSHILRAHGSTYAPAATSFAMAIFSLVLQTCITRVKKILLALSPQKQVEPEINLNAKQILPNKPVRLNNSSRDVLVADTSTRNDDNIISTPVPALLHDSQNKYDSDTDNDTYLNQTPNKQADSCSGGKRSAHVKRGGPCRDELSEGDMSDSILSTRSDSSSSSGFEILGTDYSSDEEEKEMCEKPQVLKRNSDESPSENTSVIQGLKDNNETQTSDANNSITSRLEATSLEQGVTEKPKIVLAAKFALEEVDTPPDLPATDNISDTLTQLCRDIQDESCLWVTRAFSIWLHNNPVMLASCAQNCAMLWSRLATLLNILPNSTEFIQHGVFAEFKNSCNDFFLTRDWSQSHPLLEDKLLYGFLQDENLSKLKNIFISSTPEEEQCLTRLIYLRRFGLLMAANKTVPAFTFDTSSQLFVGPAQKELINSKLAEEARLAEQTQVREKQNTLMKALANQRLKGQVDLLRTQQKHLKANLLPFVLIPDALSLCNQLNTLKRLVNSKKFNLIIANVTLRILDEMKGQKQNFHVRQALRYIEHEFESSEKIVRPQTQNLSAKPSNRDKRKLLNNPTVVCINELFEVGVKHAEIEGSMSTEAVCLLFDESIIQNFLTPGARTFHQFAHVLQSAAEVGVTCMSVSDFFYKWVAIKKSD